MAMWDDLGFEGNLYDTAPIPPTPEGASLLVGRKKELRKVENRLTSSNQHLLIEGDSGVGKTSLISIAAFKLAQKFYEGTSDPAIIPVKSTFQLSPNLDVRDFKRNVLYEVVRAFEENYDVLKRRGFSVPEDVKRVSSWLSDPVFKGPEFGVQLAGFGGNYGNSSEPNTSLGFSDSGFENVVERWLENCFPSVENGGFVCVIDNMELLETSKKARDLLESMRDTCLNIKGIRWVLCGARGIIGSVTASPRLEGRLHDLLKVEPIADEAVPLLIEKRILSYRKNEAAVAPVGAKGFGYLYDLFGNNLRSALSYSTKFSTYCYEEEVVLTDDNRDEILRNWVENTAKEIYSNISLTPKTWEVFDGIVARGGKCSPNDYESFNFSSNQAMRPKVRDLEEINLTVSSVDESDRRRKTISLTSNGWLVSHYRSALDD